VTLPGKLKRREFLPLAAIGVASGYASLRPKPAPDPLPDGPPGKSAVAIIRAESYSDDLVSRLLEGIKECRLDVRGKTVLLKPNLVEYNAATVVNTDARVVAAAYEVFQRLGAAKVTIGEGPGHRRDTLDLASDAKYRSAIDRFEDHFVDLNRDDVSGVKNFGQEKTFYFSNTVLAADLIVSLAKMKTHHWAGVTLSMKNLFGLVPGSVYGWPKNNLHFIGIPESVVALNRFFRNTFAIVDGVVGMEGDGPIQGTPKAVGALVMGRDLVSVDATCCRIMGVDPEKVAFLRQAADLGHIKPEQIDQRGERIQSLHTDFQLVPAFSGLRLS
jgi:uncharacterized protein (DUF362 family)